MKTFFAVTLRICLLAMSVSVVSCSKDSDGLQPEPEKPVVPDTPPAGDDEKFDPSDNTSDVYYAWTAAESRQVAPGVTYTRYAFTNFLENIHVLEVDLTNPKVTVETSMADDLAPNPNART